MSKNTTIYVTNDPNIGGYKFLIADSTSVKDVFACSVTEGERITAINILNNNVSSARVVTLYINDGTTDFKLGAISIAANSGTDGTAAAVDGLSAAIWPAIQRDMASNKYRLLKNGWKIRAKVSSAVAADNDIEIAVITEKFTA